MRQKIGQNKLRGLTALVLPCLLFFCLDVFAANNNTSDSELTQKIEDVLMFDEQIKPISQDKSELNFDPDKSHKIEQSQDAPLIDIIVNEQRTIINTDIRTKEKIAYNAANAKQYEAAIELFKQVVEAEPDNFYAAFSLATIYQKLGQFKQAKALYYKLLQTNPENKEAIIGNVLSLMIEESPQASLYVLSRLASQNPNSAYILARTASAYAKAKNYDQAINMMHRAINLDPTRIDYKYNLAVIYDEAQNYDKALSVYNEVMHNYAEGSFDASGIPIDKVRKRINTIKEKV